jgi:hypothetical protein
VIQDNKEQLRGSQSPRNFEIKFHTIPHPRVRKYELYPHPSQKRLGERLPEEEETKLRRGPALGTAGAPPVARERWRWWRQEREFGAGGKELPDRVALPRPYIRCRHAGRIIRPNWARINRPPRYSAQGADIPAWNTREPNLTIFDKTEFLFDENLNLCA